MWKRNPLVRIAIFLVLFPAALSFVTVPGLTQNPNPADRRKTEMYAGKEVAVGQVIVKFNPTATRAGIDRIKAELDTDLDKQLGGAGLRLLRSRSKNTAAILRVLAARRDVLYAEPDYVVRVSAARSPAPTPVPTPDDPKFSDQWALDNSGAAITFTNPDGTTGSFSGIAGSDIDAVNGWATGTGTTKHVVGIVDTGIDYTHPDLAANVWAAPAPFTVTIGGQTITCGAGSHGFNSITNVCDPADDNFHGTHISGIIGARGNDSYGVSGVNWQSSLIGLKFIGSDGTGNISDAINVLEFAVQVKQFFAATPTPVDIRVLNNSWNIDAHSQALLDQISRTNENNMLIVASAGNGTLGVGDNNDLAPSYPASYAVSHTFTPNDSSPPVSITAASNVISVAATDYNDELSPAYNFGKQSVHLAAPGVQILSTLPGGSYGFLSGTSQSAAFVSGASALVLSECSLGTGDLKRALLDGVDKGAVGSVTGLGTLFDKTLTGGRLNVSRALGACAVAGADLSITISDSADAVKPGNDFSYNLLVTNNGPSSAVGVTVTAELPAGVTFVSASQPADAPLPAAPAPQVLTFTLGNLSSEAGVNLSITVTAPSTPGVVMLEAEVSGSVADPDPLNNRDTENTRISKANSNKTNTVLLSPAEVNYGQPITLTAQVTADQAADGIVDQGEVAFYFKRTSDGLILGPSVARPVMNGEASITFDSTNSFPAAGETATATGINLSELDSGNYAVVAEYAGVESDFKDSSDTKSLRMKPTTLTVTFIGTCATFYGTDPDCLSLDNLRLNTNDPLNPADNVYSNGLVEVRGFVFDQNFDTIADAVSLVATGYANSSSDAKDYPMELGGISSGGSPKAKKASNYQIVYVRPQNSTIGFLVVQRSPLSIIADNKSRLYGEANPLFTATYRGFVLDDDRGDLSGELAFATRATESSDVGTYAITPGGLSSRNYDITFVDGTLTIKPAPTATAATVVTVIVTPTSVQYSDLVTLEAFVTAPNPVAQTAVNLGGTMSFSINGVVLTPTGSITGAVTDGVLKYSGNFAITKAPGDYSVVGSYCPVSTNVLPSYSTGAALKVIPEDARVAYTGVTFVSTPSSSSSTATVTLRATIQDITSVTGDPAHDPYAGDIRNATVTFINRDVTDATNPFGFQIIARDIPVKLLDPPDAAKTGTVSYDWVVNIGSSPSGSYNIGIVVGRYYARNVTSDDTIITVSKPTTDFITGGGFLVLSNSAGYYPGESGTKANFGFNLKFNKALTQLQGKAQIITRNAGRVYKIRSNSASSLVVRKSAVGGIADFTAKANIQDVTNPLAPISIDGNASLQVTITDNGEPGSSDTIGVTVWDKDGRLMFSSRWEGTPPKTLEKLLGGGNVVVR